MLREEYGIVAAPKLGKKPHYVPLKDKWVARARKTSDKDPPLSREQRALIYKAHCIAQADDVAAGISDRHLRATGEKLTLDPKVLTAAKNQIGKEWAYIQSKRPKTYSGLNVRAQADVAGHWFPKWYEATYSDQSRRVHAVDPISYLNVNAETGEVGPRWFSIDNTIKEALYCANILFLGFTSCLNENIGLGDETEKLLGGFLEDMRKVYVKPAAGE